MTEKRFKLSEPNGAYILDGDEPLNCAMVVKLLNALNDKNQTLMKEVDTFKEANKTLQARLLESEKENEKLKSGRILCLDCEYSDNFEIGCLCGYDDCWVDCDSECENFKECTE